jgi:hypothetical protein
MNYFICCQQMADYKSHEGGREKDRELDGRKEFSRENI